VSTGTMRFAMLFSLMPLVIGACNNNSNYNPVGITSSPVTSTETPTYRDI